tara:strand:- start:1512 stop:2252 length:741 start_codon:yes stop_codon:yes gene_type:complete
MTTPKLKPVTKAAKGHNRFCGPAALSIIAGVDTAEAAAVIRHVNKKRSVTGTHSWEIIKSLNLLGYRVSSVAKVDPLKPKNNPTLAAWLKSDERDGQSLYLIAAGHHWQVVQGRRFCCGITKDIVSIRDEKVKRRARVTAAFKIEQERKVALAEVLPPSVKAQKEGRAKAAAAIRTKARALANAHNIEIEVAIYGFGSERDVSIIVWGPRGVALDNDPFEGDHYADDWADALARVEDYVKLLKELV